MKYTVAIDGSEEILVDGIEFGMLGGSPEGNIDMYISVTDNKEDIYTDTVKSSLWVDWLNNCMGTTRNASEKIKSVVATVYGGTGNKEVYRTVTIEDACIASYKEIVKENDYYYEVVLQQAARKTRKDTTSVTSKWSGSA